MRNRRYLRVFLASPGDVREERDRMVRVIRQLNNTIGVSEDVTLELVRWETHAWPGFGVDAQAVINRQVEPGDIFVGILWRRIGTATNRSISGTVEEFERAYGLWEETGQPTMMLYFNAAAPPADHSGDDAEQYRGVTDFRELLADKGALYWEYRGAEEFEEVVFPHLYREVLSQLTEQAEQAEQAVRDEPEAPEPAIRDDNAQRVLTALEQSRGGQGYRTVKGLAAQTKLSTAEVERVLNGYPHLVMRSRLPDTKGAALFKYRR